MSEPAPEAIYDHLTDIAADVDPEIDEVIVFGSTARGDRDPDSDTDVLVISSDWDTDVIYERAPQFLRRWDHATFGSVDVLCLTPDEYAAKKDNDNTAVADAAEEGVHIDLADE